MGVLQRKKGDVSQEAVKENLSIENYIPKTPFSEKVMIHREFGKVWAGEYTATMFRCEPTSREFIGGSKYPWEHLIRKVLGKANIPHMIRSPKERFHIYTQELGCAPLKFIRMWNACMCKAFIHKDTRAIADKFCRGNKGRFSEDKLNTLADRREVILTAMEDGQENIIPFLLRWNNPRSVSELRKAMGKGLWKRVIKNSIHRNKLLACYSIHGKAYHGGGSIRSGSVKGVLDYPSGLLMYGVPDTIHNLLPTIKRERIIGKKDKVLKLIERVGDSQRMLDQLPEVSKPKGISNWNSNQWEEWHTKLRELINLKKYSRDTIDWVTKYDLSSINNKGEHEYTCEILSNKYDIRCEGEAMSHCVAAYGQRVEAVAYMVVSMKEKSTNKRHSTWGFHFSEDTGFTSSQAYKHSNKHITESNAIEVGKKLLLTLNKQYKELLDEGV